MSSSLKAGLIGAAVAIVFSLLSLVPCLGCVTAILGLVLYVGVGVLAAYWTKPPRDVGRGAGAGAVAGLITAFAGGLTTVVVNTLRFTVGGAEATLRRQFRQLPPGMREPWRDWGIDPRVLTTPAFTVGFSAVCCGLGMLLAAALGAAGGAILVSLQRDDTSSTIPPERIE
ncbi:MAG: hypothetical protein R6X31_04770 [Anaerolineae bacterium]